MSKPDVRGGHERVAKQIHFEDVAVGDQIPTLEVQVDPLRMFYFSAATYNGHRIHYDRTWAVDVEGYSDIVVHGPLQQALLARAVTDWAGGGGSLLHYSVQNRAIAYPGDRLRFGGAITKVRLVAETGLVELELRADKEDGTLLMPGTATVRLPRHG